MSEYLLKFSWYLRREEIKSQPKMPNHIKPKPKPKILLMYTFLNKKRRSSVPAEVQKRKENIVFIPLSEILMYK